MTGLELLDLGCEGGVLAVALRWLLRLNIELPWVVCLGAISLLLQPLLGTHIGLAALESTVPNLVMGGAVTVAFLGVAQVLRGY